MNYIHNANASMNLVYLHLWSSLRLLLRDQHAAVLHLALPERVHGLGDALLRHGELHNDRLDLVLRRELDHVAVDRARGNGASVDVVSTDDERDLGNGEVACVHGEREDLGLGSKDGDELFPVWRIECQPFSVFMMMMMMMKMDCQGGD